MSPRWRSVFVAFLWLGVCWCGWQAGGEGIAPIAEDVTLREATYHIMACVIAVGATLLMAMPQGDGGGQ